MSDFPKSLSQMRALLSNIERQGDDQGDLDMVNVRGSHR